MSRVLLASGIKLEFIDELTVKVSVREPPMTVESPSTVESPET